MKTLRIAPKLDLPLEFVTQACAILAKRRVGKSYTLRRILEQLLRAGQQTIIVDPKGDAWGIRSGADGKTPGIPVTIFGGEHGDVALRPDAGEAVARIAVEEQLSFVLDLSELRKHEIATFMAPFLETLYRLKAREAYRTPVMVAVDEGDAIAPQKPQPNEARMLGAAEDLVRRGGQRGIGTIFVTQRAAVLNKNVLTQAQVLIALRTIAPHDLAAMNDWIDVHGTPQQRKLLMESLPSLPVGDAWVWSPGWPTEDGIFQRVHVDPIETYDSGATPKPGEKRIEPKMLAPADLDRVRDLMADVTKREPDDEKTLRRRVAELERQVAATPAKVEVPVVPPAILSALAAARAALRVGAEQLRTASDALNDASGFAAEQHASAPEPKKKGILDKLVPAAPANSAKPSKHLDAKPAKAPGKAPGPFRPNMPTTPPEGWTMEEEALYQKFKARLMQEAPALVKVLATAPELEVTVERKEVRLDSSTLKGRIAVLIANGFLDSGKRNGELVKELGRTGPTAHPARVSEALTDLVAMGIVTREGDRYPKAPGAKVTKTSVEAG
jgi:DNA-binding HxlR family transcriptional regulator